MALNATATKATKDKIFELLEFNCPVEGVENPNKNNIKYTEQLLDKNLPLVANFRSVIEEVPKNGAGSVRTIIYCQTVKQCLHTLRTFQVELELSLFLNGFNNRRNRLELLHSATPRNVKEYVTSQFSAATNHLRVLIATIAYGTGVNCQGLSRVIHFGPPKSVQADLQESGRCGRGGEQSDAILLYNGIDLKLSDAGMKEYVKADSCRRKLLLKHFDIPHPANLPIGDNCCDSCSKRHLPLPSEELLLAKKTTDERVETLTVSAECHVIDLVYCACFSPSVSFRFINSIGCSSYIIIFNSHI